MPNFHKSDSFWHNLKNSFENMTLFLDILNVKVMFDSDKIGRIEWEERKPRRDCLFQLLNWVENREEREGLARYFPHGPTNTNLTK